MFYWVFYENEKVAWKTETGIGEREQGLKYVLKELCDLGKVTSPLWVSNSKSMNWCYELAAF